MNSNTINLILTAAVTAGDSIVVEVVAIPDVNTNPVTITDGANNYTKDADIPFAGGGLRALIFSAHHVSPLPAGSPLTITFAGPLSQQHESVASAQEFAGLGAAVPVDQTHTATGFGTNPSSGPVTTTHADDLLIGVFGPVLDTNPVTPAPVVFTPGPGYTALTGATVVDGTQRMDLLPEYRIVSAAGTYAADGTFGNGRVWVAALVAYRGDTGPAPGLTEATAAVAVSPGKLTRLANGRTRLRLVLQNIGVRAFAGPLSLVLTNLPRKAHLRKGSGFTALVLPAGLPFLNVEPGSDAVLNPGEVLRVTLEFTGRVPRRFRPTFRIIAGVGLR